MPGDAKGAWVKGGWRYGRIWRNGKGKLNYTIRANRRAGVPEKWTGKDNERDAYDEYDEYRKDPLNYVPGRRIAAERIFLDEERITQFLAWSRDDQKNSAPWRRDQARYLRWWAANLKGVNLRTASLDANILPPLNGTVVDGMKVAAEKAVLTPSRAAKIRVLRTFYTWLREVRRVVSPAEDPSLTLKTPQATPEQWRREKAVPRAAFEKVVLELRDSPKSLRSKRRRRYADLLIILGGTGWHVTELGRFVKAGVISPLPPEANQTPDEWAVLMCPLAKGGEPLRTRVSKQVAEAAERLLTLYVAANGTRRTFARSKFDMAMRMACEAAGVEVFNPGQMRHSVATWAVNAGADLKSVSTFLNHKSERTTKRFYATHAVAGKVPTLV